MPVSILMSKMVFVKYIPIVRPKLVPKSKFSQFINKLGILDVPDFNKFRAFLILVLIRVQKLVNISKKLFLTLYE